MDIQTFLHEAYPAIFERAIALFPEFAFEPLPNGKGYRSTNSIKIDGTEGNRVGGVYYYAEALYGFKDYTRGFISIYAYIKQRDGLQDSQVLDKIAEISGKIFAGRVRSAEEEEKHRQFIRKTELLEEANNYFIHCLSHKDNQHANSARAAELRNYLLNDRRYPLSILRLPETDFNIHQAQQKMELGFIPDWKSLNEHLRNLGFSMEEMKSYLTLPSGAGYSHNLTIPYRNKLGIIRGFAFRNIQHTDSHNGSKYLYSIGLERGTILFGLRKQRGAQLVLVEGMLDAMSAAALGLEGVIAIGGATLTDGQLEELLKSQPQSITLCLDNDHAGRIGTERALEKLLPHSEKFHLYIATTPAPIKDLDELIAKEGIDAAKKLLHNADSIAYYYHRRLVAEAQALQQKENKPTDKDFDFMLQRITETELLLQHPLDVHRFRQLILEAFRPYALTAEILQYKSDELRDIQQQKQYLEQLTKLHRQAGEALSKGKIEELEKLYTEKFRALRVSSQSHKFQPLLISPSEAELKNILANQPPSLESGYAFSLPNDGQPLLLPSGAISFFCAPTSHGKTTMLINLAINLAQRYNDREIHFFTYEEAQPAIFLKMLNAYMDLDISYNNPQALEQYFRTDNLQSVFPPAEFEFLARKNAFFTEMIASKRLHIHYVEYNSAELIEAIHYLQRQGNVGAIIIDYMQLLKLEDGKKAKFSRQEELKQICMDLKDCAIDTGLPLILGAQFNREVTNHFRIHATKIGEAGDIERIASVVVGMWNNDFEPFGLQLSEENQLDSVSQPNTIYLKLLKNRGGRVGGSALLRYNGNRGKIYADAPAAANVLQLDANKNVIKF